MSYRGYRDQDCNEFGVYKDHEIYNARNNLQHIFRTQGSFRLQHIMRHHMSLDIGWGHCDRWESQNLQNILPSSITDPSSSAENCKILYPQPSQEFLSEDAEKETRTIDRSSQIQKANPRKAVGKSNSTFLLDNEEETDILVPIFSSDKLGEKSTSNNATATMLKTQGSRTTSSISVDESNDSGFISILETPKPLTNKSNAIDTPIEIISSDEENSISKPKKPRFIPISITIHSDNNSPTNDQKIIEIKNDDIIDVTSIAEKKIIEIPDNDVKEAMSNYKDEEIHTISSDEEMVKRNSQIPNDAHVSSDEEGEIKEVVEDGAVKEEKITQELTFYKCDFCDTKSGQRSEIKHHLNNTGHMSASTLLGELENGEFKATSIHTKISIQVTKNKYSSGPRRTAIAMCPICFSISDSIYECAYHAIEHHQRNVYGVARMSHQALVPFPDSSSCLCSKRMTFGSQKSLHKHWQICNTFPLIKDPPKSDQIVFFQCPYCHREFAEIFACRMHIIQAKCSKRRENEKRYLMNISYWDKAKDEIPMLPYINVRNKMPFIVRKKMKYRKNLLFQKTHYFKNESKS